VWHPPDPYEPTSELYRLMPRRPVGDDPVVLVSPDLPRWRTLAAKARPASRRTLGWVSTLVTLTLAGVLSLVIYAYLSGN
jgi:hypothetical protein